MSDCPSMTKESFSLCLPAVQCSEAFLCHDGSSAVNHSVVLSGSSASFCEFAIELQTNLDDIDWIRGCSFFRFVVFVFDLFCLFCLMWR